VQPNIALAVADTQYTNNHKPPAKAWAFEKVYKSDFLLRGITKRTSVRRNRCCIEFQKPVTKIKWAGVGQSFYF
jgi:hypothetical protein